MTKRIFRSIFGVALIILLTVFAFAVGTMYDFFMAEQEKELKNEGNYIAIGIEKNGLDYLEEIQAVDNPLIAHRVTWIDSSGIVIFDSEKEAHTMDNHKNREEVKDALEVGEGISRRYSNTVLQRTIYYAKELSDGTILRISTVSSSVVSLLISMSSPIILMLCIVILMSYLLAMQTAKNIVKPINSIDLEYPEFVDIYEELTPLLRRISAQNHEIRRQIQNLKQHQQAFDTITSNMQEGLFVLDETGCILSYNEGALQLMDIVAPEEKDNIFILNRGESFRRCVDMALKGNHHEDQVHINDRVCQIFANPVVEENVIKGVVLVLFDITEKEERENLRREFTANVSHELKTPLTSISGFAEIIKNDMVRKEDIPKFASNIYEEAQRLIVLVQDIIKLSQLDEKKTGLEAVQLDLEYIVKETVNRLRSIAEKKEVSLTCKTEKTIFNGIPQIVQEIIYNLCDNAIRYNKYGGSIDITLENREDEVYIAVEDTGIGIAKKDQGRIFERFYRVSQSRCKDTEGTGLGLAIVKHGISIHGGKIALKSQIGKGTKITVTLPK